MLVMYIVFGIQIITLLAMIYCLVVVSKKGRKSSSLFGYSIRYLAFYGLFLTTIGLIPMYNSFMATAYCSTGTTIGAKLSCYEGIYFLHLAVSIIGLIFLSMFLFIFGKLYIDLNPCSTAPFAQTQTTNNLVKTRKKSNPSFSLSSPFPLLQKQNSFS